MKTLKTTRQPALTNEFRRGAIRQKINLLSEQFYTLKPSNDHINFFKRLRLKDMILKLEHEHNILLAPSFAA